MKKYFFFLFLSCVITAKAQYLSVDTAKLNIAYKELMENNTIEKQKAFLDAFPSNWQELIVTYQPYEGQNYDVYQQENHINAFLNKLTLIDDSTLCSRVVSLAIGARDDANIVTTMLSLQEKMLQTKAEAMLNIIFGLTDADQMLYWQFFWSSIYETKIDQERYKSMYDNLKDRYPNEMKIMSIAYDCFHGKSLNICQEHIGGKIMMERIRKMNAESLANIIPIPSNLYSDKYNLDFKLHDGIIKGWMPNTANSLLDVKSEMQYDTEPITNYQIVKEGKRQKMKFSINSLRNIMLPELKNNDIKIIISYKAINITNGMLSVYLSDKDMKNVASDTIMLRNSNVFRKDSVTISAPNARFLFFDINAVGKDSTYVGDMMCDVSTTIPQEVSLSEIDIYDGQYNIGKTEFKDIPMPVFDTTKCVDLTLRNGDLRDITKRITAFGESAHAGRKMNLEVCNDIASSVLDNKTKLILMEGDIPIWLFFNNYIQGGSLIKESDLKTIIEELLAYNANAIIALAQTLREYNQKSSRPVTLIGMESGSYEAELYRNMSYYLRFINSQKRISAVDKIATLLGEKNLMNVKSRVKEALEIMDKNVTEVSQVITKSDMDVIKYYLNSILNSELGLKDAYYNRDSMMFRNAVHFIDYFTKPDENIVIATHLSHANYVCTNYPTIKSFGSYMKHKYGADYSCIGILAWEDGTDKSFMKRRYNQPFPKPAPNSLEAACEKTGLKRLYIDSSQQNELVKIRLMGNTILPESEADNYLNSKTQVGGFLFIK